MELLRQSEARYRVLVELSPDAIFISCGGRFVFVNPATVRLLGAKKPADLLDRRVLDFVHPDYRKVVRSRLGQLTPRTRALPLIDEKLVRLDGSTVDVEVAARGFMLCGRVAVTVIARNVSRRVQAEAALRESEERFSTAFHSSPVGLLIGTLDDGRVIDANQSFLKLYGARRPQVIRRSLADLKIFPVSENSRDFGEWVQRLRHGGMVRDLECWIRTRSGGLREGCLAAEMIELAGEKCVLAIIEDITERKQLEREILQISEREQSRIGNDLHDGLCQDLAGAAYLVDRLCTTLQEVDPELARQAQNISEVVHHARDEAHGVSAGLYPVRLEENGLMSALEELASATSQRFGIRCRFRCKKPVLLLDHAAATHIYRVAQEAVSNAIRHGKPESIDIELAVNKSHFTMKITDTGRGLPANPGRRGGMGLQTMQYRCRMIPGGSFKIRRGNRRGTIVTCTFPTDQIIHEPERKNAN